MANWTVNLWIEGVSPPFPSEYATAAELEEFVRRFKPVAGLIEALPENDWEVAEFPELDLHIVKIPYQGHTYAHPYMQRNVRSNKLRLIITFRDYQSHHLRRVYDAVVKSEDGKLYKQAETIAKNSTTVLELQKKVEKAALELKRFLEELETQSTSVEGVDAFTNGPVIGRLTEGVIVASSTHVYIRLPSVDENQMFQLARNYVSANNLGWHISKPYAWTEKNVGPHVTIAERFRANAGETVPVLLEKLYHFVTESRWVAIMVHLPAAYMCVYECHLSIGQERLPPTK